MRTIAIVAVAVSIGLGAGLHAGGRAVAAESELAPPPVSANCKLTATKMRTAQSTDSTTSMSYVTVPEGRIKINRKGSKPGCVVVHFSALGSAAPGQILTVAAFINGVGQAEPGNVQFAVADTISKQRTVIFLFHDVPPGKQIVKVSFRSLNGGSVTLYRRTVEVEY